MSEGIVSTIIICAVLTAICIYSVIKYKKNLSSGCCGASKEGSVKKIRVADKEKSHYPYTEILKIDGMSCGNCANRVENALNSIDGVWSSVDLGKQEALVRMKHPVELEVFKKAVLEQGYVVIGLK